MIDSDYKCQFEIAFNFSLYFYHFTPLQFITIILHQRVQIKFILAVFKIYVESANQKACFPRITTLRKKYLLASSMNTTILTTPSQRPIVL